MEIFIVCSSIQQLAMSGLKDMFRMSAGIVAGRLSHALRQGRSVMTCFLVA